MGWWRSTKDDDEVLLGDTPLDALGDAVRSTVEAYQESFGRKPSKREWETLLALTLGCRDEVSDLVTDEGDVVNVRLELGPKPSPRDDDD